MSLRQFGLGLRARLTAPSSMRSLAVKGVGLSIGATMLIGGAAVAQTTPSGSTTPGDVIINTGGSNTGTSGTTGSSTVPSSVVNGVRFACQTTNGQPTVMYFPDNQPNVAYPWAVPTAMGGGWSPERRCAEIARRLESYRPDGLVEMKTGIENGLNTICVTTDRYPSCRIVLTVPTGQDPIATRDRVFQNLTVADGGQQTQGVYTYGESNTNILGQLGNILGLGRQRAPQVSNGNINLKPFLSPTDGGTGAKLTGGIQVRSSVAPTKKPRLFR